MKKLILLILMATILALYLATTTQAADMNTYIVLYKTQAVSANAVGTITKAGGTLVYSYNDIGVVIARSSNASFRNNMLKDKTVQEVAPTAGFAVKLDVEPTVGNVEDPIITPNSPAPGNDPLSGLQWDMVQIHAPEARAVEGGSSSIVVGVISTGIDFTHPDLAANIDFANSVSCVGGVPNQDPPAWIDNIFGVGTHDAGVIAAALNGIGIVGVAPNVKIAAIKASNAAGLFFPEAVVCSFMWAGSHSIPITSNSYFADPWLFNCRNDSTQRAIWEAERRAIRYAIQKGTVVVASEGFFADDLAHPTQDVTSPDDTTPVTRTIHNDCAVIPVEIPGVIGVTSNGNLTLKSYYSNYGVGVTQVIAPGGDGLLQRTAAAPNGMVLSTWPASLFGACPPTRRVSFGAATYCYLSGTSAPHVAGVAALLMSEGVTSPNAVASIITGTADSIACPTDLSIYDPFPSVNNGAPQVCQGGIGYNSFNGRGQVNALSAVTFPH